MLRTCYGRTAGLKKRGHLHFPGNGKGRFRWADTFHKKNIQGSNKNTITKPIYCNENSHVKIGRCQGYEQGPNSQNKFGSLVHIEFVHSWNIQDSTRDNPPNAGCCAVIGIQCRCCIGIYSYVFTILNLSIQMGDSLLALLITQFCG